MSQAIYLRVSTDQQQHASQEKEINDWLLTHPLQDIKRYVDTETGNTLDRPAMIQLRKDIDAGLIDTVVCARLDRLARKALEGLALLADWQDKGIRVVSVTQQLDMEGHMGRFVAMILLGVAEMEQNTRRERCRAGIEIAKAKGKFKGRKPGANKRTPVREILEMHRRGMSVAETARILRLSYPTVNNVIKREQGTYVPRKRPPPKRKAGDSASGPTDNHTDTSVNGADPG